MRPILAIAMKDLRLLVRDKGAAFFTFIFPLALAIFFGMVFGGGGGGPSGIRVALVVEDPGPAAAALAADLAKADGLTVTAMGTRAEGETAVRRGKADACVVLPGGFQEQADNILAGQSMRIEARVDPRRQAEAGLLTGKLNEIAFIQMSRGVTDTSKFTGMVERARSAIAEAKGLSPQRRLLMGALLDNLAGLNDAQARLREDGKASGDLGAGDQGGAGFTWRPVTVDVQPLKPEDNTPQNAFEISFPQGIVWGLMGCVVGFGVSMASERTQGTLMRLSAAPIGRHQIILGKALGCFLACVLVQGLLILMGTAVFGVHIRQPVLMGLAVVSSSLGFVGVMMLMVGLMRTEGAASGMGRAVVLILAMIGGGTIPLAFMPPLLQKVSGISPFSWSTLAIEGAVWRGFTLAEMLWPCGVLAGIGLAGFVIGLAAMRWADRG